jgi:hypothetical protein
MRKKRRSAAILNWSLAGTCVLAGGFFLGPMNASAQEAQADLTLAPEDLYWERPSEEELARPERADYWAARAARETRRAARRGEPAPVETVAAEAGSGEGGGEAPPAEAPAAEAPGGGDDGGGDASVGGPSDEELAMLRDCESGGDYSINTGNGYYGAYQFLPETWWSLGYEGYPHEAAPAVQDQAVRELWAQAGWYPWPGCSKSFGWI